MTTYAGEIAGDLTLFEGDDARAVTRIRGNLDLNECARCEAPQLTFIAGFLDVSEGAVCALPQLAAVGGCPVPDAVALFDLHLISSRSAKALHIVQKF